MTIKKIVRILKKEISPKTRAERDVSFIFFWPNENALDTIKRMGDFQDEVFHKIIPEALDKADLGGATKFLYMENPASIPVTFVTNEMLVDKETNKVYDLHVAIEEMAETINDNGNMVETQNDDYRMRAAARKVPYFRTNRKRQTK
jgi:hypothetical protein